MRNKHTFLFEDEAGLRAVKLVRSALVDLTSNVAKPET